MTLTLEALEARHGDALLLHYGSASKPELIVIDGGPSGVYNATLSKRLNALKAARSPNAPLSIRMLMVSHIDDDHINGVLQWLRKLEQIQGPGGGGQLPFKITTLWHNSFDDILGNEGQEMMAALQPAVKAVSTGASIPSSLKGHLDRHSALVLASVKQGRDLRLAAENLALDVNAGFKNLVMVPSGAKSKTIKLGNNLSFTVLGPHEEQVKKLQEDWDKKIDKMNVVKVAEFLDDSVYNLSSIIVLAKLKQRTMLLTGDARGDHIIEGIKNAKLFKNGVLHVDLLKVPHHGSDRNVTTEFFEQVTADHYVISGNGEHGNPDIKMLKMLLKARKGAKFTIYLTNEEPRLVSFFKKDTTPGKKYIVVFRSPQAAGVQVHLDDPIND